MHVLSPNLSNLQKLVPNLCQPFFRSLHCSSESKDTPTPEPPKRDLELIRPLRCLENVPAQTREHSCGSYRKFAREFTERSNRSVRKAFSSARRAIMMRTAVQGKHRTNMDKLSSHNRPATIPWIRMAF